MAAAAAAITTDIQSVTTAHAAAGAGAGKAPTTAHEKKTKSMAAHAITRLLPTSEHAHETGEFIKMCAPAVVAFFECLALNRPTTKLSPSSGGTYVRRIRVETTVSDGIVEWLTIDGPRDAQSTVRQLGQRGWKGNVTNSFTGLHLGSWYIREGPSTAAVYTAANYNELCFDIDLNDYADVRADICQCGEKPTMCDVCMWLLHAACRLITRELAVTFGFSHILCCSSGRRGLHIHVFDREASALSSAERKSIAMALGCPEASGISLQSTSFESFLSPPATSSSSSSSSLPHPLRVKRYNRPKHLTSRDGERIRECMPFFLLTYVTSSRKKGPLVCESKSALIAFLQEKVQARKSDTDAVLSDFCSTYKSNRLFQAWSKGPAATAAIGTRETEPHAARSERSRFFWLAFRKQGIMREIIEAPLVGAHEHPSVKMNLCMAWSRVRCAFECWLLERFLPRLDYPVTSQIDHNIRMPWSRHHAGKWGVLPFDHTLPTNSLIDLSDRTIKGEERALNEGLRVTLTLRAALARERINDLMPSSASSLDF